VPGVGLCHEVGGCNADADEITWTAVKRIWHWLVRASGPTATRTVEAAKVGSAAGQERVDRFMPQTGRSGRRLQTVVAQ
jgi:hypothetical protein